MVNTVAPIMCPPIRPSEELRNCAGRCGYAHYMTTASRLISNLQNERRTGNISSETEQHLKHEFRKLGRDATHLRPRSVQRSIGWNARRGHCGNSGPLFGRLNRFDMGAMTTCGDDPSGRLVRGGGTEVITVMSNQGALPKLSDSE
jgi:hypothetical protein